MPLYNYTNIRGILKSTPTQQQRNKKMITQSLHFEITGQDAQRFLSVCQERNIEPMVAFESFLKDFTKCEQNKADDKLRVKKIGLRKSIV